MSAGEILYLVFGIFSLIVGTVLIFLAFKFFYKYLIQEKKCIAKTKGVVERYTFLTYGDVLHLPVVYYVVDGVEYKVVGPKYETYVTNMVSLPFGENKMEYDVDDQVFSIKIVRNSFGSCFVNPIKEMYPIGTEIDVFYDPSNPKLAYVLRYCNLKYIFWMLFVFGVLLLILSIFLFFII